MSAHFFAPTGSGLYLLFGVNCVNRWLVWVPRMCSNCLFCIRWFVAALTPRYHIQFRFVSGIKSKFSENRWRKRENTNIVIILYSIQAMVCDSMVNKKQKTISATNSSVGKVPVCYFSMKIHSPHCQSIKRCASSDHDNVPIELRKTFRWKCIQFENRGVLVGDAHRMCNKNSVRIPWAGENAYKNDKETIISGNMALAVVGVDVYCSFLRSNSLVYYVDAKRPPDIADL